MHRGKAVGVGPGWALGAAVLIISLFPCTARAGSYEVWSCRGPTGAAVASQAWVATATDASPGDVTRSDGCSSGGALSVAMGLGTAFAQPEVAGLSFIAPTGTTIADYTLFRHMVIAPPDPGSEYVGFVQEGISGEAVGDYGCTATCTLGDPSSPLALANSFGAQNHPLDRIDLLVGCFSSPCDPNLTASPASLDLYRSEVTLEDPSPPTVPTIGGSVVDGHSVSGEASVTLTSSDAGSGIASISMSLDGGPAEVYTPSSDPDCRLPYVVPVPCPLELEHTFRLDTVGLSPGSHTASGAVTDAAGNTTQWGPVGLAIAPTGPVKLRLASRGGRIALASSGRGTVAGVLDTSAGLPISGAQVSVTATALGTRSARGLPLGMARTGAAGTFSVAVHLPGAYKVTASYAPPGQSPATVSARTQTPIAVTLGARPVLLHRGQVAALSGVLRGAGASTPNADVQLQVRSGSGWIPVVDLRPNSSGSFAYRHRFTRLSVDTIFTFRAVVRVAPGWPWAETASPAIHVRVNVP